MKTKDAKLWVFRVKLMTAKPPNKQPRHYRFAFLRLSDFFILYSHYEEEFSMVKQKIKQLVLLLLR